jgi:F-type H+-transporting ATPase subunit b
MVDLLTILGGGAADIAEETTKVAEPTALGLAAYTWVSIAMAILILIFLWKKVPQVIAGGLDSKIAEIREQLDEAKKLRSEAETLRDEYAAKIAGAEKDAEAMMDNAQREADAIVEKAEADSAAMVARRKQMAEDKIAAAERDALEDVRASAAQAAAAASHKLIAEKHDAKSDKTLADELIDSI